MKNTNFLVVLLALLTWMPFRAGAQQTGADECDFTAFHAVEQQIKANPGVFVELPEQLVEKGAAEVAVSPDGNLRIYSFNLFAPGTIQQFLNIVQYKEKGRVHNFFGSMDRMATGEKDAAEMNDGGCVASIRQVKLSSGRQLYLLFYKGKISFDTACMEVMGFVFDQAKPAPYDCFMLDLNDPNIPVKEMMQSHLSLCYSESGLSDLNPAPDAASRMVCMDADNLKFYQAELADQRPTGRYIVYHFDGKRFVMVGRDGGFWLHPSVGCFKSMEIFMATKKFQVRVDRLHDGSLRYACWKAGVSLTTRPDLVLFNGKENVDSNVLYQFRSGSIYYELYDTEGCRFLRVRQGNKVLVEDESVN